jgi:hypothetical protein
VKKNWLLILVAASAGCQQPPVQQTRLSKLPSATEVFNLRTKCARLGQELDESMPHGSNWSQEVLSNYSIKENRCYIVLDGFNESYRGERARYLYDGQTQELLASANLFRDKPTQSDRRDTNGVVWANHDFGTDCHEGGDCGYTKADAYIDSKIKREE